MVTLQKNRLGIGIPLKYLGMGGINLNKFNNWLQIVNKIPYLTSLLLENCNLANIFFVPLTNSSTSLDALYLPYNGLTSSSSVLEWLFNYNTSVVELYLFGNQFQDMIPNAFIQQKNVYYNKKNRCNNIEVIAIVYVKCCNKI